MLLLRLNSYKFLFRRFILRIWTKTPYLQQSQLAMKVYNLHRSPCCGVIDTTYITNPDTGSRFSLTVKWYQLPHASVSANKMPQRTSIGSPPSASFQMPGCPAWLLNSHYGIDERDIIWHLRTEQTRTFEDVTCNGLLVGQSLQAVTVYLYRPLNVVSIR